MTAIRPNDINSVMGFDYGRRRIGVAVGQTITSTASALPVVHWQQQLPVDELGAVIKEWRPQLLLVGLPLLVDGSWQEMANEAFGFARKLGSEFNKTVLMVDERHSSQQADAIYKSMRQSGQLRRKDAKNQDSVAARLIVERWLQELAPGMDLDGVAKLRLSLAPL